MAPIEDALATGFSESISLKDLQRQKQVYRSETGDFDSLRYTSPP
jgi:hypothetical protein